MKTFKWHDVWRETPETNGGISELLIVNYAVTGKDSSTGKCYYEYALCFYNAAEKCFTVIGSNLLDVAENQICLDWKYVNQWSYIPYTEDVNELKHRVNNIANYIDKYTDECQDCPVCSRCVTDSAVDMDCRKHIVKYLSGD